MVGTTGKMDSFSCLDLQQVNLRSAKVIESFVQNTAAPFKQTGDDFVNSFEPRNTHLFQSHLKMLYDHYTATHEILQRLVCMYLFFRLREIEVPRAARERLRLSPYLVHPHITFILSIYTRPIHRTRVVAPKIHEKFLASLILHPLMRSDLGSYADWENLTPEQFLDIGMSVIDLCLRHCDVMLDFYYSRPQDQSLRADSVPPQLRHIVQKVDAILFESFKPYSLKMVYVPTELFHSASGEFDEHERRMIFDIHDFLYAHRDREVESVVWAGTPAGAESCKSESGSQRFVEIVDKIFNCVPLSASECQQLSYLLARENPDDAFILERFNNIQLTDIQNMIACNSRIAVEVLHYALKKDSSKIYSVVDAIMSMSFYVQSVDCIHKLYKSLPHLSKEPLIKLIRHFCAHLISSNVSQLHVRMIRIVSLFIASLISDGVVKSSDLIYEVQTLCVKFAAHPACAALFQQVHSEKALKV